MSNKAVAAFFIWCLIGGLGIWFGDFTNNPHIKWSVGYLTGLISCGIFYLHMELSE